MQILKELDGHPNIVCLKGAFFTDEGGSRLNLVLEFLSDTLHRARSPTKETRYVDIDMSYCKCYIRYIARYQNIPSDVI